ncbi:prephenate dehydrogenase [Marilutibacter aestuarii]|uniref:Prephenate dehydrogenase n=1 Tax=Marilutibacter aestuarii TaxID=1706195 RepID=A0A508ALK1_9GAMM|nr:prephenate dehydrogenase [Lysobacter aestuarii]TQD49793.1 prephenate dehydrogenase [Lysobacter aestuarii]
MTPLPGPSGSPPVVGIVGRRGAYGRWLQRFFEERMGLQVIGRDPAGDEDLPVDELVARADVLVFSAPIRVTPALIGEYVEAGNGREAGHLWMDLTSIKQRPVEALLASQAEVVGLHPMAAPPPTPTLQGRAMAVCPARLDRWRPWLDSFLSATRAERIDVSPEHHDRAMALVQGLTHASHMAQASVLRRQAPALGGLDALRPLRTVGHALDLSVSARMLAGNPGIYTDIQFDNPHVLPAIEQLAEAVGFLRAQLRSGDAEARQAVRSQLLEESATFFGAPVLAAGSQDFERLGYLLADLESPDFLSVFLPEDAPGSLRRLLHVFEEHAVNIESIHSSRSPEGELHFRIGLDRGCLAGLPADTLARLATALEAGGIGRVTAGDRRD